MNVVYATDDNYVPYCSISILSLLENNQDLDLHIYILDNGISSLHQQQMRELAEPFRASLTFVDVRAFHRKMTFSADSGGFNQTTLVRLFLPEYLPDLHGMILYLDCDTVVTGSVKGLLDVPMRGRLLAAVPELYMPQKQKNLLGLGKTDTYFNAGVLWINLDEWRRLDMTRHFLNYYGKMNGKLLYSDQDIINACCRGKIATLSQRYNLNPNLCYFPYWFIKRLHPDYETVPRSLYQEILRQPVVAHYMGDERPWIHGNHSSFREFFEKYEAKTVWHGSLTVYGKEGYMFCYHMLNLLTRIFPHFRLLFTNLIGIRKYRLFGKK